MGFREGLEAFLIIAIMLEYVRKIGQPQHRKDVFYGLGLGILLSIVFGLILFGVSNWIGTNSDTLAKLWEFIASFAALFLITTFIVFMIRHSNNIVGEIEGKMKLNLSATGILLLATIMVAREGAEIALFSFASANETTYIFGALVGVLVSGLVAFLINKSLIRVNLKLLFQITLIYLIFQAGFMLGYGVHELLSYWKAEGILDPSNPIYTKLFNASGTVFDHSSGVIGIPLYITIGWYSRPEIIQFILQYSYTIVLLVILVRTNRKNQRLS